MKLSGSQLKQIQTALLSAYTESELRQMLCIQMEIDLDHVAGGTNFEEITFNLIQWAERNAEVERLIQAAYSGNKKNSQLIGLVAGTPSRDPASNISLQVEETQRPIHQPIDNSDLQEVADRLRSGRLTLFLGDEVAEGIAGLPSRQELADQLAERQGIGRGQRLSAVAQQAMKHGNRWDFSNFLMQKLEPEKIAPGVLYQELARFIELAQPELVTTTAYHRLLELSLQQHGIGHSVVVRDEMLRFVNSSRVTLLKLFGDIQQIDTLTVTEQDYHALLRGRDRPEMLDEVRRAFRRTSVLFLGCDLRDPAVSALFDEVTGHKFQTRSYAVWSKISERERDSFAENRGLKVLPVEPLAFVQALLQVIVSSN